MATKSLITAGCQGDEMYAINPDTAASQLNSAGWSLAAGLGLAYIALVPPPGLRPLGKQGPPPRANMSKGSDMVPLLTTDCAMGSTNAVPPQPCHIWPPGHMYSALSVPALCSLLLSATHVKEDNVSCSYYHMVGPKAPLRQTGQITSHLSDRERERERE